MINLTSILKQILKEAEDTSGIWYHGSTADIDQKDLDPLHRDSEKYKGDADKQKWSRTGSSDGGVGIYFGKDKQKLGPTAPMQYTGFHSDAAPYTQGFMYEMKLKPNVKVINESALHRVGKNKYDQFRQEGVDALIHGDELNVLNPDAINYFKKIMQWKKVPALYPLIRGKAQIDQMVTFNDDQELLNYLKKELGDYRLVKTSDKQLYQPTDDDINKVFQYSSERKWFNV